MNHISTPRNPQSLSPVTPISTNLNQPHLPPMDTFTEHPPLPSSSWDILISGSGVKQSLLAV